MANLLQFPSGNLDEIVFGKNPFPVEDHRHSLWAMIARAALEEELKFRGEMQGGISQAFENPTAWILDFLTGLFNIRAKWLVLTVRDNEAANACVKLLSLQSDSILTLAREKSPEVLTELQARLSGQSIYWTGKALRCAREWQAKRTDPPRPEPQGRKVSPPTAKTETVESAADGSVDEQQCGRKDFVMPLLEKLGWSLPDWANNSNVDYHTVDDYLKGETNPYLSTRKKLADALGVSTEELPQ